MGLFRRKTKQYSDIAPDEIFLDSRNAPNFDVYQFEGKIERPLPKSSFRLVAGMFLVVTLIFVGRLWSLQVAQGSNFAERSANNTLRHGLIFAERGSLVDRNGVALAWNTPNHDADFSDRHYATTSGNAHILGYVSLPQKDSSGFYYQEQYAGISGIERALDAKLAGTNGLKITEENALLDVVSESTIDAPDHGANVALTIDTRVQEAFYTIIKETAEEVGFQGGGGVLMDIETGEIISMVSYPEYSPEVFVRGEDDEAIQSMLNDPRNPFLNRMTSGLYTPGSIVKPFVVLGALNEEVISPWKEILSTGSISVQNPYNPDIVSTFVDWKAHGYVNAIDALAVSSNVYMYAVGGGYEEQEGIGISNIERYVKAFGIGEETGVVGSNEVSGVVPNPAWKAAVFDGEDWRLGDTYNTAIGQYGFQVTALQMVRAVGGIAREGQLVTPTLILNENPRLVDVPIDVDAEVYGIIQRGMRQAVLTGTARGLNLPHVHIAAKTGTAELGVTKNFVNSWVVGYYPYNDPQYAFAVVMESGPAKNLIGGVSVMNKFFWWLTQHTPEYLKAHVE